ncbi:MAG: hypothetical protein ABSB40_05365 [Nitrososphaeria archaeon]|jgi:hypothetical protein
MKWEEAIKLIIGNLRTRGEMKHDELVDILSKEIKGKKGLKRTIERCLKTLVESGVLVKKERGVYKWFESVEPFATGEKYQALLEHSKNLVAGFISLSHDYGGILEEFISPNILRDYVMKPEGQPVTETTYMKSAVTTDLKVVRSSELQFSLRYMSQTKPHVMSHLQAYPMEKEKVEEAISLTAERKQKEKLLKEEIEHRIRERFDELKVPKDALEGSAELVYVAIENRLRGYKFEGLDRAIDTSSPVYDSLGNKEISAKGYGEEVRSFLDKLRTDAKLNEMIDERIKVESKYYDTKKLADELLSKIVLRIASGEPLKGRCEICSRLNGIKIGKKT